MLSWKEEDQPLNHVVCRTTRQKQTHAPPRRTHARVLANFLHIVCVCGARRSAAMCAFYDLCLAVAEANDIRKRKRLLWLWSIRSSPQKQNCQEFATFWHKSGELFGAQFSC